jgi:hypothetical protein
VYGYGVEERVVLLDGGVEMDVEEQKINFG